MTEVIHNTLHLTIPGTFVTREELTLRVKIPDYPDTLPRADRIGDRATGWRQIVIPIELVESVCVFDPTITFSPGAQELCLERGVAVNFLREYGRLLARFTGVADLSATLRRIQLRAADNPPKAAAIARSFIAGKLQNFRNSLLRAMQEMTDPEEKRQLQVGTEQLARHLSDLARLTPPADALEVVNDPVLQFPRSSSE